MLDFSLFRCYKPRHDIKLFGDTYIMTSFDDRKKGFENKFAHEEQLDFAVEARCSKLFGLWIAEKIGLNGADADKADLDEKGVEIPDEDLRIQLDRDLAEAKKQIDEQNS